jgi:peptidoglycan/LPS O-acetylase OafA/YrhL
MVSSVFIRQQIESGNDIGAAAVSVVLLVAALLMLGVITWIQRWGSRHERSSGAGLTVMPLSGLDPSSEGEGGDDENR